MVMINKIIVTALMVTGLILGGCAKHTIVKNGMVIDDVSKQSVITHTQEVIETSKNAKIAEAIAAATTSEQAMLIAFWLGKDDTAKMVVTKDWDERLLPWVRMVLPLYLNGGIDLGNNKSSGPTIKGDKNHVYMLTTDSRRDTVVGLNDNDTTTKTTDIDKTFTTDTDIDKSYDFGD